MYLSYTSKRHGGGQFEEARDTLSTSPQGQHNTTQLSSTTISCVEQRLLGTHLKQGGMLYDQQDQTIIVIYLKTKYKPQDRWDQ